jgi:hypothetical protein
VLLLADFFSFLVCFSIWFRLKVKTPDTNSVSSFPWEKYDLLQWISEIQCITFYSLNTLLQNALIIHKIPAETKFWVRQLNLCITCCDSTLCYFKVNFAISTLLEMPSLHNLNVKFVMNSHTHCVWHCLAVSLSSVDWQTEYIKTFTHLMMNSTTQVSTWKFQTT